jgi:ribonuclease BN (tRNA processing enzyme)
MQTFAYLFKSAQKTILYSGDIADPDFLFQYLKQQKIQPDLIFHDITFFKEAKAHAFYQDVAKYLGTYSIIGYHHDHRMNPVDNPIPCVGALNSYLAEPCHPV